MNRLLIILFLLLANSTFSQHTMGKVTGTSENGSETLPGATVYWQGTTIGTVTDTDGMFIIKNPDTIPSHLIISSVGFISDTISVNEKDKMDFLIQLKKSITLKEVKIEEKQATTSYSTMKPIGTETISGKELLKAACCNLSESFSTNASVDVAFTDAVSGAKKIQMLGLDGVYTQILSENMPLSRGLASAYGLNYIPGTWIENIMVTKGTGSVVNGFESISGQINLEFLKPQDQKKRFFINIYGNEKGRAEANIHFAKKVNDKWSTLLFTHASDASVKNDMNHDGFLDMPLTKQYTAFNRWNYHSGKRLEAQLGVKGLYESRQGGQVHFNSRTDKGTTNFYGIGITTKQLEYFSKTGILFPATPYKSIGIQTAGKWENQEMFFGLRNYSGEHKSFYANVIFANIIGTTDHKYKVGASYMFDDYHEKFNDSSFARKENIPGVFAEYTYTHAEKFSMVAGVREDYHNIYGFQFTPRLHLRFNPSKKTTLRLSGGKGFRTANVFTENQAVFASSRKVVIQEKFKPEIAWNYGFSANQKFRLFHNEAFVNVDLFHTDFQNQVVVDLDQDVHSVVFHNLNGRSYSNSLQVDFGFEPIENFAIKMAYKWYDVKTTYNYELLDKPYVPKHRVMFNMAYSTYMEIWKFDVTLNWFGESRIPSTVQSQPEYKLPEHSQNYFLINSQITKKFRKFDLYLGCENILNYTQKNPVIAADTPFGTNFDASMIYAPVDGRTIYGGLRLEIK